MCILLFLLIYMYFPVPLKMIYAYLWLEKIAASPFNKWILLAAWFVWLFVCFFFLREQEEFFRTICKKKKIALKILLICNYWVPPAIALEMQYFSDASWEKVYVQNLCSRYYLGTHVTFQIFPIFFSKKTFFFFFLWESFCYQKERTYLKKTLSARL